ncbi:MAG: S8 family serine peptidase [Candidatus Latescibacterota bacterium]|nr:MAG: S8 family serine peptidase [Candidatus Latescibacterota bacterium]
MRQTIALLSLLAACWVQAGSSALAATRPSSSEVQPGERWAQPGKLVVKFVQHPGDAARIGKAGLDAVDDLLASHGVTSIEPVAPGLAAPSKPGATDLSRVFVVEYSDGSEPLQLASDLARLAGVEYAEPLWAYPLDVDPNDPDFGSQFLNVNRMQFPAAWDLVKGEQGDVVVAIVDGGTYWQHADLQANVWQNPGESCAGCDSNGIDDDGNGFIDDVRGWNFANSTNDPTGLPSTPASARHGTHTAGIACAVANNGINVAGVSWNAKVMPLCTAVAGQDGAIGFGYQGIIYAAQNGADIINCSWGGSGSPSVFELEVINLAHELGAVIVAAAGNGNSSADNHYPSAYPHVLSVANVDSQDRKANGSNFGFSVDVSAQGQHVLSTVPPPDSDGIGSLSGTSMSAPHAAGVCALVKTKWPGYSPDQVIQRVRVTSDNIDNVGTNIQWRGLLGFGRVNAHQALTKSSPAIRVTEVLLEDEDGDQVIEPNETVTVSLEVTNFLDRAEDVSFSLDLTSIYADVVEGSQALSSLDAMETQLLGPFTLQIRSNAPQQLTLTVTVDITSTTAAYTDKDRFQFVVQPVFVDHNANNIKTSVSSLGRLGFALALGGNGSDGIGFIYKGGPNLLFEGALMLGISSNQVSDGARGELRFGQLQVEDDFATLPGGVPHLVPQVLSDLQSVALFNDSKSNVPLGVELRQDAFQFVDAPDDDYIILRYRILNASGGTLSGLRVGWYNDWDIGNVDEAAPWLNDRTGYDASRGLGYAWDNAGSANGAFVGVTVLTDPGTTSYRGIWNDNTIIGNPFGVFDGYTKDEKWLTLSGGVTNTDVGPEDISNAIATGPFDIAPGNSVTVAFAYLAGDNLADLQTNADAAAAMWQNLGPLTPITLHDLTAAQEGQDVVVRWRTSFEEDVVAFRVLRARQDGALVPLAPDVEPRADRRYTFRDPNPGFGRYEYRLAEITSAGTILLHGGVNIEVVAAAPAREFLGNNVPNPFNPRTTLQYGLARGGPVRLVIYDGRGRRVRTLVQNAYVAPGVYSATWDGTDDTGRQLSSGVYHARLELAGRVISRRMTLLK